MAVAGRTEACVGYILDLYTTVCMYSLLHTHKHTSGYVVSAEIRKHFLFVGVYALFATAKGRYTYGSIVFASYCMSVYSIKHT